MLKIIACIAALLLIASCGPRAKIASATPRSVTVSYNAIWSSLGKATNMAETHCQKEGRHARLISDRKSETGGQNTMQATFDCME